MRHGKQLIKRAPKARRAAREQVATITPQQIIIEALLSLLPYSVQDNLMARFKHSALGRVVRKARSTGNGEHTPVDQRTPTGRVWAY